MLTDNEVCADVVSSFAGLYFNRHLGIHEKDLVNKDSLLRRYEGLYHDMDVEMD